MSLPIGGVTVPRGIGLREEEWRSTVTSDRRGDCPEGELLMEEEWRSLAPNGLDEEE